MHNRKREILENDGTPCACCSSFDQVRRHRVPSRNVGIFLLTCVPPPERVIITVLSCPDLIPAYCCPFFVPDSLYSLFATRAKL